MADKIRILINTILNVKQEDLQKQLDSVAKKIKINLKPIFYLLLFSSKLKSLYENSN
jgi:hypothetical protein